MRSKSGHRLSRWSQSASRATALYALHTNARWYISVLQVEVQRPLVSRIERHIISRTSTGTINATRCLFGDVLPESQWHGQKNRTAFPTYWIDAHCSALHDQAIRDVSCHNCIRHRKRGETSRAGLIVSKDGSDRGVPPALAEEMHNKEPCRHCSTNMYKTAPCTQ
ncbi:hypothetical protein OE88DRAFT_1226254 [Heliocybe sulcata]|uniref:Uncharacterized protein n=1 Tax=Heliocybe sulcata TaxID=5364 RepID=A0A5C3MJB1_9AGAM|nr:hypothetical protein OE88DRAFT_1226254 [Heliocybe sulcata]